MLSKRSATIRPRAPMRPHWGRRPIRVKAHGSVLHAMLRVGLAPAGRSAGEERLEAEFEVAHSHDAVDRTLA